MLTCYDYRRGLKNLTQKQCLPNEICQATWLHQDYGTEEVMWRGCSPINQTGSNGCGKKVCTFLDFVDYDTKHDCTRGVRCCCTTNLCNKDIRSHGPHLYTKPCYPLPKPETPIDDKSSILTTFFAVFIPLVFFLLTIVLLIWIKKMTSRRMGDTNMDTHLPRSYVKGYKLRICRLLRPLHSVTSLFGKTDTGPRDVEVATISRPSLDTTS